MPVTIRTLDPTELIWGALSLPPVSLVIACLITGGILLFAPTAAATRASHTASAETSDRYTPERRTLRAVAVAMIVVFVADILLLGYVITGSELIHWWRFALPIVCAAVGLGLVLVLVATRGTSRPDAPIIGAARRDWRTFSPRAALVGVILVALVLVTTTVAAGLASSTDGEGRHIWLAIPIPNEPDIDPLRLRFYGWTYGVPVLIALVALVAVAWAALDRNAARPYSRPESVTAERAARRATAAGVTRISTAAMLLTLAGAWRLIADGGAGFTLTIMGQNADAPYDATWRYAELAGAAGWSAPILEIIAFVLLILVAAGGLGRSRSGRTSSAISEATNRAEAVL